MPIANLDPIAEVPVTPVLPETEKTTYLGIVADSNKELTGALVAYLDGMPWSVDYFGQLLGKHNDLRSLDPGQNAAFQQYQLTKGVELRVSSALSSSYDQERAITTVTGSAILPYLLPNVNDYFIADAGSQQYGLYRVTRVERKIFNRNSVYSIDYELVEYVTEDTQSWKDLVEKVVRSYRFSKERAVAGLAPVLREEQYALTLDMAKEYHGLLKAYFKRFFNRSSFLLVVPKQQHTIFDSGLVTFLEALVDSQEAPEIRQMKVVSLDYERYAAEGNLWTVLLDRNYGELSRVHQKATLAPKGVFNRSTWLRGPIFWQLDYFVYPKVETLAVALPSDPLPKDLLDQWLESTGDVTDPSYANINTYVDGAGNSLPIVKPVLVDDYYVLSEAFYQGGTELSVLEILIKDYLKAQSLDLDKLAHVVAAYPHWPVLEQFYYGPLLVLLLREAIRGFYL